MIEALPVIENIKDYRPILEKLDVLGGAAPTYRKNLLNLSPFTSDATSALLAELPISVGRWISLAEQARCRMRTELVTYDGRDWDLAKDVVKHAEWLHNSVFPAVDELYSIVHGRDAERPWTNGMSSNAKALSDSVTPAIQSMERE